MEVMLLVILVREQGGYGRLKTELHGWVGFGPEALKSFGNASQAPDSPNWPSLTQWIPLRYLTQCFEGSAGSQEKLLAVPGVALQFCRKASQELSDDTPPSQNFNPSCLCHRMSSGTH